MTDTLKRLSGPAALTASAATAYTVPGSTTAVLRNIRVVNETGSAATFTISLGTDAAGKRLWYAQNVAPGDSYDWTGNIVLVAAEILQAYASITSTLTLTMSGVESA